MTTTTELHAAIAQMQVLMTQAAEVIEHNTKSLAESHERDGVITDTEVQASIESDTDLVAHLRTAALPFDQRHKKPEPTDSMGMPNGLTEAETSATASVFGLVRKPAQQGQAIDIAFLRQVLSVAIAGLFEHHKNDVLRVFTLGELQAVADLTEPLQPQQVEDIYKRAWVMLATPQAQPVVDCHATGVCVQSGLRAEQPAQQQLAATITITQRGPIRIIDNNFDDCVRDWPDGEYKLYTSPQPPAQRSDDTKRLDALAENSWDLRCFDMPTGADDADIGWRVIEHHMAKPNERTVAEVFRDDPRQAIDAAIEAANDIKRDA